MADITEDKDNSSLEYTSPPVGEVALGVQFEPIVQLDGIEIGRLSLPWSTDFPIHLEQPSLPHMLPPGPTIPSSIQIGFIQQPRRYWFLDKKNEILLQLQNDRIILNWRKINESSSYPRYEELKKLFKEKFNEVNEFVTSQKLGEIKIDLVDLEYTNFISPTNGESIELEKIVNFWKSLDTHKLGNPEVFNIDLQFDLQNEKSSFSKMIIVLQPFQRPDGDLKVLMKIRVVSTPQTSDFKSGLEALDTAHSSIIASFDELMLDEMHKTWGKIK